LLVCKSEVFEVKFRFFKIKKGRDNRAFVSLRVCL
jgi:hypothetical protein